MRRHPSAYLRRPLALVATVALLASCGGDEPSTTATSANAATEDPSTTLTGDVDDGAILSVECVRGSSLEDLPYDPAATASLGDVPTDTRWLQRTFVIENRTDHAVAFEPAPTVQYLDAEGEVLAELVDIDRNLPAFTVAAGQTAHRTITAFDGFNAEFLLPSSGSTVDEVLDAADACVLAEPAAAVQVDPWTPPADVDVDLEGPCALDDQSHAVQQDVVVTNRTPEPIVVEPTVEVLDRAGERVSMLGAPGPTVVDAGATATVSTSAGTRTLVGTDVASCALVGATPPAPSRTLLAEADVLVDASRPTAEILDGDGEVLLAGRDDRQLPVTFLRPAADGPPRPLVLWLHGLGGHAFTSDPLLTHLADAGYVVALVDQPETSSPANSISGHPLLPGDVSAILDGIADPDDGFADDLAPVVDLDRVALGGHSIGAAGVYAIAAHPCCEDDRIDAAFAFGSSPAFTYDGGDYAFARMPLLLVHGSEDEIASPETVEEIVDGADDDVSLLMIDGADHFSPVYGYPGQPHGDEARAGVTSFLDEQLDESA